MNMHITDEGRKRLADETKRMLVFAQFWTHFRVRKSKEPVEVSAEELTMFLSHLVAHIAMGHDLTPESFKREWQRHGIFISRNRKFVNRQIGELLRYKVRNDALEAALPPPDEIPPPELFLQTGENQWQVMLRVYNNVVERIVPL